MTGESLLGELRQVTEIISGVPVASFVDESDHSGPEPEDEAKSATAAAYEPLPELLARFVPKFAELHERSDKTDEGYMVERGKLLKQATGKCGRWTDFVRGRQNAGLLRREGGCGLLSA